MYTVDLRRMQRRSMAGLAVAAFACMAVMPLQAEVANPNLIPADSAYIISVPDSAAFWSAWSSNGIYAAFKKVEAMPEVQQQIKDFEKELSIIESSLGFKIDGATLSKAFSSVDIYVTANSGKDVKGVGIFKIADADKVHKLLDLAEKAAAKAAASDDDDATSETKSADAATSAVTVTDYQGVKIKSFKNESNESKLVYAEAGDLLLMSSDEAALKKAIDRTKAATPGADTFANAAAYQKINAALAKEKGEAYFYTNNDAVNKMNSSDVPSSVQAPLEALVSSVAPVSYTGASVKIAPKELYAYSYGTLKEGSSNSLVMKAPGDKPLAIASYVPETTLLGVATSLVDAEAMAKLVSGFAEMSGNDDAADKVKSAEAGLGFSLKNDLVPAIGNEFAFSLSNVEFGGLIPTVDATIIIGVKDKAKMTKVVSGIERMATNAMAAKSGDTSTSGSAFQSEDAEGQTLKYMAVQTVPGLTPGYVLTDDYLFIGSTKNALTGALKAKSSGKNLATGSALTSLGHGISGNANTLSYMNFGKILDIAKKVTQMIPAAKEAGKYIEALDVIDVSGSATRVEDGAIVSRSVLKLK